MPVGINQPSNQIKLTNVSLVRMKKGKKRFEIACYKNKVLEWRSGVEKDLDNVLQIPNVFINVSKGQVAPAADLKKSFPEFNGNVDKIVLEILNKGDLQVGEKERQAQLDRVHAEVIDIVAGKLVDPRSKRVYTSGMIEKALDQLSQQGGAATTEGKGSGTATPAEAEKETPKPLPQALGQPRWTGVVSTKSAKEQALSAMKALIAHQPIPIARARMRLRITCPPPILKHTVKLAPKAETSEDGAEAPKTKGTVKDAILGFVEEVETQNTIGEDEWEVVGFVEPGAYKTLTEFIGTQTKGRARAEVLDMAVISEATS